MPYAARAALRMQSLNDEACRLMGAGGERDLSRAEDLLRRALAMEVVEQTKAQVHQMLDPNSNPSA